MASPFSRIPDLEAYRKLYRRSLEDPEGFWAEAAREFTWFRTWNRVLEADWKEDIKVAWYEGGLTNICVNAIERHLPKHQDRLAYLWIGNDGSERRVT
jgi:acetyl-CoA synthetase